MKLAEIICVASLALGFGATAQAQIIADEPNVQPPQLGQVWYETEGDWQGTWTPLHPAARDGVYAGRWAIGRNIEHSTLQVTVTGLSVGVVRTQPRGTCRYRGLLNRTGNVVNGTYTCDWATRPMNWRASIGSVIAPSQAGDAPAVIAFLDYLKMDWAETEGDWRGRWTQRNPGTGDGLYDARWTKGNEHANATLEITIEPAAGRMNVRRRDPDGRQCTYIGTINSRTARSVDGTYRCSGQENGLPWHAAAVTPSP